MRTAPLRSWQPPPRLLGAGRGCNAASAPRWEALRRIERHYNPEVAATGAGAVTIVVGRPRPSQVDMPTDAELRKTLSGDDDLCLVLASDGVWDNVKRLADLSADLRTQILQAEQYRAVARHAAAAGLSLEAENAQLRVENEQHRRPCAFHHPIHCMQRAPMLLGRVS